MLVKSLFRLRVHLSQVLNTCSLPLDLDNSHALRRVTGDEAACRETSLDIASRCDKAMIAQYSSGSDNDIRCDETAVPDGGWFREQSGLSARQCSLDRVVRVQM